MSQARRRRWLPRFSIAALFVLTTAAAIGAWYWFQWPFEVRNVTYATTGEVDPFVPAGTAVIGTKGEIVRVEVETVRRVWSRDKKTIRHGPRTVYDGRNVVLSQGNYLNGVKHGRFAAYYNNGKLRSEEYFERGQLHGASRRWDTLYRLAEETNYDRGRLHGKYLRTDGNRNPITVGQFDGGVPAGQWTWFPAMPEKSGRGEKFGKITGRWRQGAPDGMWECRDGSGKVYLTAEFDNGRLTKSSAGRFEQRLAELLANGLLRDPEIISSLLKSVRIEFIEVPLCDVAMYLSDQAHVPVQVGIRGNMVPSEVANLIERESESPKPEIYVVPLSATERILVPVDPNVPFYQIELELPHPVEPAASPLPVIEARNWPLTANAEDLPLIVAFDRLLSPQGLACDYRYGVLWIDRASAISGWKDATGVSDIRPPPSSALAELWERTDLVAMEFVQTPFLDALQYIRDQHGPGLELDTTAFPPIPRGPRRLGPGGALPATLRPVTIQVGRLPFKHSLGLLLDQADCRVTLRGQVLVIAPREENH